ncbi:hypothetical protein ACFYRD_15875 [Streptomyces hirsutus]
MPATRGFAGVAGRLVAERLWPMFLTRRSPVPFGFAAKTSG